MATLFQTLQFFNGGAPLEAGKLYWYEAGTSNPKLTWKDRDETTPHVLAYITLDGTGRPPGGAIFIRGSYKLVIKDKNDNVLQTIDKIDEYDQHDFTGLTASIADLNSTTTNTISKNSNYTITLADRGKTILVDATSGDVTINLLASATALNTYQITIKKIDVSNNVVNIIPSLVTEKIDDQTDFILYDYNDVCRLQSNGSTWHIIAAVIRETLVTQTTDKTLTLEDDNKTFKCDASAGSFTLTLPDARVVGRGFDMHFKKIDSSTNYITLTAVSGQLIDDDTSYVIHSFHQYLHIKGDGANWWIVADAATSGSFIVGDVKATSNIVQPGWVVMNDGSIGNASSGATARANADTKNLFIHLWNRYVNDICPVEPGGRGASALADYNANKRLTLFKMLGRSIIGVGRSFETTFESGKPYGVEHHQQTVAQLAIHSHVYFKCAHPPNENSSGSANNKVREVGDTLTTNTGSGEAFSILHPVVALDIFMKL